VRWWARKREKLRRGVAKCEEEIEGMEQERLKEG